MIVSSDRKTVVMSLKPRYSDLIVEGQKTVELRRQPISNLEGLRRIRLRNKPSDGITLSVQSCQGSFRLRPEVWTQLFDRTGIRKKEFLKYFAGCATAYALEIEAVWVFKNPVSLDNLRTRSVDLLYHNLGAMSLMRNKRCLSASKNLRSNSVPRILESTRKSKGLIWNAM